MESALSLCKKRFDLEGATFSRVEQAHVALVYRVLTVSGQPFILKIHTRSDDYLRELYFLTHLQGRILLPRIVRTLPEAQAMLLECLPGGPLARWLTDSLAFQAGALLARIHEERAQGYGDPIHPEAVTDDVCVYFSQKFDEEFTECMAHLPETTVQRIRHIYERDLPLLRSMDGPCFVHRDFRGANLIVSTGRIEGLVDWAGARAGFAQQDFCPLEHGEWPGYPAHRHSFLEGYTSVRPVPEYQAIMPFLRLGRALAIMGLAVKGNTWTNSSASGYRDSRRFLESL